MPSSTLKSRIAALPHRTTLNPLRNRWPDLFGGIFQVDESRWSVFIVSKNSDVCFKEVAEATDRLFTELDLHSFVRQRKVQSEAYVFWLVEPFSHHLPESGATVI